MKDDDGDGYVYVYYSFYYLSFLPLQYVLTNPIRST